MIKPEDFLSAPPQCTSPSYIINIYMCISNYARILIVQYGAKNPPKKVQHGCNRFINYTGLLKIKSK